MLAAWHSTRRGVGCDRASSPVGAFTLRVLDLDGREVHYKVKGDTQSERLCGARNRARVFVAQSAVDDGFA
jgi:hypothetical protein